MNKEIRKRKKRFGALCMASMLLLCGIVSTSVVAADYNLNQWDNGLWADGAEFSVKPGDTLTFHHFQAKNNSNTFICYYNDAEGSAYVETDEYSESNENMTVTVKEYSELGFTDLQPEAFKEWKVTYVNGSSESIDGVTLTAVPYTQSTITYVLAGGTNSANNPTTYYEGKEEITLEAATREHYVFDGWYSGTDLETKVETISTSQTGNLTLYATYVPENYDIHYELDGGNNSEDNPSEYVYSIGVDSFDDASKEGYTFDGWFCDAEFKTEVKSISRTQSGEVTLYAKFTKNSVKTEETTETKETKETTQTTESKETKETTETAKETKNTDNTPKTGDSMMSIYMLAVLVLSAGTILLFLKRRSMKR